jgi:hypothetical protein
MSYRDALGYESFTIPIATVLAYAGQSVPAGFLKCDGASYSIADYPDLFSEIENVYGGAAPNFNVPDMTTETYIRGATTSSGLIPTPSFASLTLVADDIPTLTTADWSSNINTKLPTTFQIPTQGVGNLYTNIINESYEVFIEAGLTDPNQIQKKDTGTSNAATVNIIGSNAELVTNNTPINIGVSLPAYQMIYIIKARYAPLPSFPQASPTAYIDDFYLRNPNTLDFNPKISGFIFQSNLTPL